MLPYYISSIDYSMDPSSIELKKFLALTEYSVREDVSSADSHRSPSSSSSPHSSPIGLGSLSTSTSVASSSFGSPLSQQTLDYDFCKGESNRDQALLLANRKLSLDIEHQRNINIRHDMVFDDIETPLFPNNLTVPLHFIGHELHKHQPIRAKRSSVLFQRETFLSPNNSSRESSPLFGHSDSEDADGESEDSDADGDYVPPTEITTGCKRRRAARPSPRRKLSHSPSSSSSFSHPAPKRARPLPGSRVRHSPPSRNKQASSVETFQRAVEDTTAASTDFICPECGWQQVNRRMPDFKRHLKTHTRPSESDQAKGWWCKGVLLEHSTDYHVSASSQPYDFLGQQRVGGCLRTFSRRDALKRHLDNSNTICIGRPCEATED